MVTVNLARMAVAGRPRGLLRTILLLSPGHDYPWIAEALDPHVVIGKARFTYELDRRSPPPPLPFPARRRN
jgi:hypothetical protein